MDSVEVGSDNPFATENAGPPDFFADAPGLIDTPERITEKDVDKQKTGPPSVSEWQDFFGRIVVRLLLEGYLALMLGDIELTPREEAKIALSKSDLKEIAAPFAVYATKNDWARKHGREIIALADSYEAGLKLIIWMRHVSKIRKAHKGEIQAVKQQQQPKPSRNLLFSRNAAARQKQERDELTLAQNATEQRQEQPQPLRLAPVITMPAPEQTIAETVRQAANGNGEDRPIIRKPSPPDGRYGFTNNGAG
jgi:hypothetical protein